MTPSATMTGTDTIRTLPPAARAAEARRRRMSVLIVSLFLCASGVLTWSWSSLRSSSAAFSDSEVVSGNRLGTGTVDIAVGNDTVLFTATNLAAGDRVAGQLVIENTGSFPLAYRLASTWNPNPLSAALDIVAWNSSGECLNAPPVAAPRWRPLLDTSAAPSGPTVGRLAQGETRLLCLTANLPISAPSNAQGRRVDLIIGIIAEHDLEAQARLETAQDGAS